MREFGYPPFKAKEKGIKKSFIAEGNTTKEGTETIGRGKRHRKERWMGKRRTGLPQDKKSPNEEHRGHSHDWLFPPATGLPTNGGKCSSRSKHKDSLGSFIYIYLQ